MARSLNRGQIIGNVVKDGDYRLTPQNTPICVFTVATNRNWKTAAGEQKEEADYHRVVAWQKLAEICSQLIKKGVKVYVEGRMSNKRLADGSFAHEIVADDIIVLERVNRPIDTIAPILPTIITEVTETVAISKEVN